MSYVWKSQSEAYKEALEYIRDRRRGAITSLVTPWEKLNDASADGLEWKSVTVIAGRPGCLSGESRLYISRDRLNKGSGRWYTIEELFHKFNGEVYKSGKWDLSIPTFTQSYKSDEKLTGLNQIIDVYESGVKPLYEVVTESGKTIKTTLDHRFLVDFNDSYKKLSELTVGDNLVVKSQRPIKSGRKIFNRHKELCGKYPYYYTANKKVVGGKEYQRVAIYRAIYDANLNGLSLEDFKEQVRNNPNHNLIFSDKLKDIHHINGDHSDHSLDNLQLISRKEHNIIHSDRSRLNMNYVEYDKICSITYVEDIMTYDIEMKAPYNNFIANGIVVHNSGKTLVKDQIVRSIPILNPKENVRVLEFSMEMVARASAIREFSAALEKPYKYVISCKKEGLISEQDFLALKNYSDNQSNFPIDIVEESLTISQFDSTVRDYFKLHRQPDGSYTKTVITIDHSILFSLSPGESEYNMLMALGKSVTALKKEFPAMFIILSQLGRGVDSPERNENGKYGNYILESDIYMGDLLMQFADMVIGMNRPGLRKIKYYGPDRFVIDDVNVLVWHFLKARNGNTRISFFKAEFDKMRIVEIPTPPTQHGTISTI